MRNTITGRKVNLKDSFKELVEKKLSKFDRIFGDTAEANVTVTLERNRQTVEVTIRHGGIVYRAEETSVDMNDALDDVIESLSGQIRKNKTRLEKKLRVSSISEYFNQEPEEEEVEYNVVRSKRFEVKPLDVEEAILQMNLIGHQFYMFRNVDTGDINVVYRRKDGDYGLIEPNAD